MQSIPKFTTLNTRYNVKQETGIIGTHNKRGSQFTPHERSRHGLIVTEAPPKRTYSTLPKHHDHVQTGVYKRRNVIIAGRSLEGLRKAGASGFGVVVPRRPVATRPKYFKNITQ